ncbi:conserved hypothetical protein [Microsporum canis CBS 113480]|uniref:Aminoglycoside phosphotransferase domain-containing protein n=1 Tax=Arthroderma otae (strain ATCC MYA-4605 / CBS 113480) TaxID=554155 RepID=C5FXN4_ARTOC|nr:conserved hypothetical protein [Microsporum canis CBS 113480]EEQ35074.1 conserved hypothetical protein [Microsporum canis CBS 113480]
MPPVTNQMLNARREENCIAVTLERKYYRVGQTWVKRSLRPSEWQINPYAGTLVVPRFGKERIRNEAASMKFIAENTDIPVPKLYCCFEDDEAVYLVTQYVEGKRKVVEKELELHLESMKKLKSRFWGGPSGVVVPPYRVMVRSARPQWEMKPLESEALVFCHNDLSTNNVIVDPETLKVRAIIDWEYAGFYPEEFEGMFYRRPGPSVALEGEVNDEDRLLDVMIENETR